MLHGPVYRELYEAEHAERVFYQKAYEEQLKINTTPQVREEINAKPISGYTNLKARQRSLEAQSLRRLKEEQQNA